MIMTGQSSHTAVQRLYFYVVGVLVTVKSPTICLCKLSGQTTKEVSDRIGICCSGTVFTPSI